MSKKLTNPEHGEPIDVAGMPVTTDPVEGGVRTENLSLPVDHEARVVWREQSAEEKKQAAKDTTDRASFQRVDATIFLRLTRDALLRATDFVELPSAEDRLGKPKLVAWRAWRQKLRDLPAKTKDPEEPKWPEPPEVTSALLEHRRLWPDLDWTPLLS
jgi:hypothetical protein